MSWRWPAALVGLFWLGLYGPVIGRLAVVWSGDPSWSHGPLVPAAAAAALWLRLAGLRAAPRHPDPRAGYPVLFAALALRLAGGLVDTVAAGNAGLFLQGLSLVLLLAGGVALLCGRGWLRLTAGPIGFLLFMVPLPAALVEAVSLPLRSWSTAIAASGLPRLGVPVLREGNVLVLPGAAVGVADACSGLHSLISLLAVAAALVLFGGDDEPGWLLPALLVSALPLAAVANALRIAALALGAAHGGVSGAVHTASGVALFAFGVTALAFEAWSLRGLWACRRRAAA